MSKKESSPLEVSQLDGARVLISEMNADGPNESVVIENMGTVAQPMTNWVLASLRGERFFMLPEGFVLQPGQQVRINSGPGAENRSPEDLLWTHDTVWNNKGDTAVLFGASGHEIARLGHGNRHPDAKGEKLLYRTDGGMYIEESKPYKEENRGWASPDSDPSPEEEQHAS